MENQYGKALDAYLRRTNTSQASFARALGVSQTIIWQYVASHRFPSKATARRIDEATESQVPFAIWKDAAIERLGINS